MKKVYNLFRLCSLLTLWSLAAIVLAQSHSYTVTYTTDGGNPGGLRTDSDASISNGFSILEGGSTYGLNSANAYSGVQTIPFHFEFFGDTVTMYKVSGDGIITFDTSAALPASTSAAVPTVNAPDKSIAGFWRDFVTVSSTSDDVYTYTYGTAPNRQHWIHWYSYVFTGYQYSYAYYAIVLEEGTNRIHMVDMNYNYTTTANPQPDMSCGLQYNSTTGVSYSNTYNFGSGGSANADNDYITFDPFILVPNNAGITELVDPVGACSGTQNVKVRVENKGTAVLDTITLNWTLDGVAQTPVTFNGLGLASLTDTVLQLGTMNLSVASQDLVAWVSNVNNGTDGDSSNDTLSVANIRSAFSGTFTVNPSLPASSTNFLSIDGAANALVAAGLCGPTVVEIAAGTYSNQPLVLPEIVGMSSTNTLTFRGMGSQASDTKLTYDGSGTENVVILFDGADYVSFINMHIENTDSGADVFGLQFRNSSNYNTIDSCTVKVPSTSTTSSNESCIIFSSALDSYFGAGDNGSYNTFSNDSIIGGYYGMHMRGSSTTARVNGNSVLNSVIQDFYYYGVYSYNHDSLSVQNTKVEYTRNSSYSYGVYAYYCENAHMDGNDVKVGAYALYCYYCDSASTFTNNKVIADVYGIYLSGVASASNPGRVENNMMATGQFSGSSTSTYGIYTYSLKNYNIYNNTFTGNSTTTSTSGTLFYLSGTGSYAPANVNIKNNIFHSENTAAFSVQTPAGISSMDHNIFYTGGSTLIRYGTLDYADLATLQLAVPIFNLNSKEGLVQFESNTDLHVKNCLPYNAGDNSVGVLTDIDGQSRPMSSAIDIGADEYTPSATETSVFEILDLGDACEFSNNETVDIVFHNNGLNDLNGFNIYYNLNSGATSTLTINDTLGGCSIDTFSISGFDFSADGAYTLKTFINLSGDVDRSNDTISLPFENIINASEPTAIMGDTICQDDTTYLVATSSSVRVLWYDAEEGGNLVGIGDTLFGVAPMETDTFWAAGQDLVGIGPIGNSITTSGAYYTGTYYYYGLGFTTTTTVIIDSVTIKTNGSGTFNMDLRDMSNGTILQSTPAIAISAAGTHTVYVGLTVPAGSDVALVEGTLSNVDLWRGYSGANSWSSPGGEINYYAYAYTTGSGMNSYSSTTNNYFFDWIISIPGCESENRMSGIVVVNPTPRIDSLDVVDVDCQAAMNGSVDLHISSGTSPFTYTWTGGYVTEDLTNISGGSYDFMIEDAKGCIASQNTIVVAEPDTFVATPTIVNNNCFGEAMGSVDVALTGGTTPYEIAWSTGDTLTSISNLVAGTYTLNVIDDHNCVYNLPFTITEPDEIMTNQLASDSASCFTYSDASLDIDATGGTGVLNYMWSNGDTTQDLTNVTAGSYILLITDENSCVDTSTFTLYEPAGVDFATPAITDILCFGDASGSITPAPFGGTQPYSYNWSNGETTSAVNGLVAGTYVVLVEDQNGCIATSPNYVVNQPAQMALGSTFVDSALCNGSADGMIDISPIGGVSPYNFAWSTSETSEDIVAEAGTYSVTITDANGCVFTPNPIVISEPEVLTLADDIINVSCNGYNDGSVYVIPNGGTMPYAFDWSVGNTSEMIDNQFAGTYTITVTDINGCETIESYTITEPDAIAISNTDANDALCFGGRTGSINVTLQGGTPPYAFNWSNGGSTALIQALPAGMYSALVTDANGCTFNIPTITVGQPDAIDVTNTTTTAASCYQSADGTINMTVVGGTPGYSFSWTNGANGQNPTGLSAGYYQATITDANGCTFRTGSVIIDQPDPLTFTLNTQDASTGSGSITFIDVDGGTPPYSYSIDGGVTYGSDAYFGGLSAGTYDASIRDANGCEAVNSPRSVTIQGVSGVDNISSLDKFKVYPNPTSGLLNVDLELNKAENISISVLDATGKMVNKVEVGNTTGDIYTLDMSTYADGLYFIHMFIGDQVVSTRVSVSK